MKAADRAQLTNEYFFSKKAREISRMKELGTEVLNLAIGSPDIPPPFLVREVLSKHAAAPYHHDYQPYQGINSFHEAVYRYHEKYFFKKVEHLKVLPLFGAKEGLFHTALAYINQGDRVLIPELAYPAYASISSLAGGNVSFYPLLEFDGWSPDLDVIHNEFKSGVKLIWINYLHMPTGTIFPKKHAEKLIQLALEYKVLIVCDNPYALLASRPSSLLSVSGADLCSIEIHSLSKSHNMAGWRIGWLIGIEQLIHPILKVKSQMDSGMFYGMQKAAEAALGIEASWFNELTKEYSERRALVESALTSMGHTISPFQEGLFVWAKIPNGTGEELSDKWLHEKGVFVTPGSLFGERGKNYIRISLCQDQVTIKKAFERING